MLENLQKIYDVLKHIYQNAFSTVQLNFTDDLYNIYQLNDATGENSFAYGEGLLAEGKNQVVFGKYNTNNKEASFIVGNGVHDKDQI